MRALPRISECCHLHCQRASQLPCDPHAHAWQPLTWALHLHRTHVFARGEEPPCYLRCWSLRYAHSLIPPSPPFKVQCVHCDTRLMSSVENLQKYNGQVQCASCSKQFTAKGWGKSAALPPGMTPQQQLNIPGVQASNSGSFAPPLQQQQPAPPAHVEIQYAALQRCFTRLLVNGLAAGGLRPHSCCPL